MEPRQIQIDFIPETHEYFVDGEKAKISVTSLIDKQVTRTEWAGIDPEILRRAADRGTKVHADCEYFIGKGTKPKTPECQNYATYIKEHNWQITQALTEYKLAIRYVSTDATASFILCGTADLICFLNGVPIVADYKTTSVIHEESVRWQMSLLDYMARQLNGCIINGQLFEYTPAEELYVLHFDKQARFTPVKVDFIPEAEIVRMLDAEAKNLEYYPTPVELLTPRQQEQLLELEKKLCSLEATKKLLEKEESAIRSELISAFQAHQDVKTLTLASLSATYTPATNRETFDTKRFAEEHPDLYKQYLTTTEVKPKVTITLAKHIKEQIEAYSPQTAQISALPAPKQRRTLKRGFFNEQF